MPHPAARERYVDIDIVVEFQEIEAVVTTMDFDRDGYRPRGKSVASPFLLVISEGSFTAGVSMYGGDGPASLGLCRRWRGKWAGPSWRCAQGGRAPLADEIWPLRSSPEDRYENALIDLLKKKEAGVTAGWHDHCGQKSLY